MRIIAGPCQHETLAQSAEIAKHCKDVCEKYGFEYYFKASFDKANRTSLSGERGVGIDTALPDLLALKETLGVKILTDVHTEGQISRCRSFVDVFRFLRSCVDKQI